MPVKNPSTPLRAGIIPGQTVTKEKLQRDPLRHVLTPHASQRIADLAERDVMFHEFDEERHGVPFS